MATTTPMAFTVSDDLMAMGDAAGLGAANSFYSVDGSSFVVFAGSFTLSVDGPRAVRFFSVDLASNTEAVRTSTVGVDGTAPVTRLLVNGTPATSGSLVLVSTDALSFAAVDAGSGVRETRYSLDGASEAVSTGALNLAPGIHTLAFRSQDNVFNLESPATVSLTVQGRIRPPRPWRSPRLKAARSQPPGRQSPRRTRMPGD